MSRSNLEARLRRCEESLRLLEYGAKRASDGVGQFAQDVAMYTPGWGNGQKTTSIQTGFCVNPLPLTLFAYHPLMTRTQLDWDHAEQSWLGCGTLSQVMPFYFMANSNCIGIPPAGTTSEAVIRFQRNGAFYLFYKACPGVPVALGGNPAMAVASCPVSLGGLEPFGPFPATSQNFASANVLSCLPFSMRADFLFPNSSSYFVKDV